MKVIALSDTHGLQEGIRKYNPIPDGDLLLIAGDLTDYGRKRDLLKLNIWLGTLPHTYKVIVAGNHDRAAFLMGKENTKKLFTNATYIEDEEVTIDGIKIYGSPWTPTFFDWFFMQERGSQTAKDRWDLIPEDVDILLTHGPPMYKLDFNRRSKEHIGCEDLRNRVDIIKPRFHIFGHMHTPGYTYNEDTQFINASICDESYVPRNKPSIFYIERR